jgi:hypothetical protein
MKEALHMSGPANVQKYGVGAYNEMCIFSILSVYILVSSVSILLENEKRLILKKENLLKIVDFS